MLYMILRKDAKKSVCVRVFSETSTGLETRFDLPKLLFETDARTALKNISPGVEKLSIVKTSSAQMSESEALATAARRLGIKRQKVRIDVPDSFATFLAQFSRSNFGEWILVRVELRNRFGVGFLDGAPHLRLFQ